MAWDQATLENRRGDWNALCTQSVVSVKGKWLTEQIGGESGLLARATKMD